MPVHDVGYRRWDGKRTWALTRWRIITSTGIRLALDSRWVKRLLFLAWLPVMYWGIGFFVIENSLNSDSQSFVQQTISEVADQNDLPSNIANRKAIASVVRRQFRMIPNVERLADGIESDDETTTRNVVWRWLLMTFFRYPQGMLILFLVGSIAPSLIAQDLRSRAYLLYFSRPIGRLEYMVGKLLIPIVFIMLVTLLPAIALYFFAIMMSPNISVFWSTWDIPLRIAAATATLVIPVATLSVMLSSLTQESRFANFAWFAVWAMGHGAWTAILFSVAITQQKSPFDPAVVSDEVSRRWSVLSLYSNLGEVQAWIFGFEEFGNIWPSGVMLLALTVGSLIILYNRVSAPIRL